MGLLRSAVKFVEREIDGHQARHGGKWKDHRTCKGRGYLVSSNGVQMKCAGCDGMGMVRI